MTIEAVGRMNLDGIRTPEQFAQEEADRQSLDRIRENIQGFFNESDRSMSFWTDTLSVFKTLQENHVDLPHTILKTRGEVTWVDVRHDPEAWRTVKKPLGKEESVRTEAKWSFSLHANSGEGANQAEYLFAVGSDEPGQPRIVELLDGKVVREGIHTASDLRFVEILTETVLASHKAKVIKPAMISFDSPRFRS